ncbi:MAG: glutamate--cysteine ligase [Gammaproteobacteria bacterium]|nr:glutamate--cysteine ligase [Gammaproteobacteria bacterium]
MTGAHASPVPNLTIAPSGPLLAFESHLLQQQPAIESWFRQQWQQTPAPFYASVDLRNAGFKVAPVDTNLFPAGFNNLNPAFLPLCILAVQSAIERVCPTANQILLIPESHTRNLHYLESVATLRDILYKAGFQVRIGALQVDGTTAQDLALPSGRKLHLEPLQRHDNRVGVDGFIPCMILLNNDLAAGQPAILEDLDPRQTVIPPLALGWSHRLKSDHFDLYRQVTAEFAALLDIDPWLITPLFLRCGQIDFMKREGEQCLADNVATLLANIQKKYDEYQLPHKPFVVIKADAGSYGMGVMTARSPDDVYGLNRKQRTSMSTSKSGLATRSVMIQEGVYTFETWGHEQAVTEPVVYMIDHFVVGGFYRVHTRRGADENLNAPGMHFEPLAFADSCTSPDNTLTPDARPNRFYAYGVIARLALLAAAREVHGAGGRAA